MKEWRTKSGYSVIQLLAGRSNVFLINCGQVIIMVDSGAKMQWKRLDNTLKQLQVSKVDYLILTHTHFDHAGNAVRLKELYNPRIMVHDLEKDYLLKGENVKMTGKNRFFALWVKMLSGLLKNRMHYDPCTFDIPLDSDHDMGETGLNIMVMHTPGHTRGSVSVIIDNEMALVGDCMFGIIVSSVYPPFAENYDLLIKSWGRLLKTGCRTFLPSHGGSRSREQLENEYNKREKDGKYRT